MSQPVWLHTFLQVYQSLNKDNLSLLGDIYHPDIHFQDPLHTVNGLPALTDYFAKLYENVIAIEFEINHVIDKDQQAALYWTMTYSHKQLKGGKAINVSGHSQLTFADNKVIYHRDYVDIGAMLYEHIPLLGSIIKAVKRRAAN